MQAENSISGVFQRCSATNKKLWTIKVVKQKKTVLGIFLIFFKYVFQKISFLS